MTSQRNVCVRGKELGLPFYASPLSVYLTNRTFQSCFYIYSPYSMFYAQSVVSSPHFMPSPCFIPSLQSMVHSLQSLSHTD